MNATNWSLQFKVAIGTVVSFIVLAIVVAAIANQLIFPSFVEVERAAALRDLERCVAAVEMEIEYVEEFCSDWAAWNDTYEYVQNRNPEFEEANLKYVFSDYDMHLVVIVDENNQVIWNRARHPNKKKRIEVDGFPSDELADDHVALQIAPKEELKEMFLSGILDTEFGPMLLAAYPILRNNGEGPIRGTFIMGRFLSEKVVESIQSQILVPFEFHCAEESPELCAIHESIATTNTPHIEYSTSNLTLYTDFADLENKANFLLGASFPREITERLTAAMRMGVGITILSVFFVLLVLLFMIRTLVIRPIGKITNFVTELEKSGLSGARLELNRSDEIGVLANKTNDAVAALEQLRILQGLLPICASCKKIRDGNDSWNQIESYIDEHSEAEFTHGICPDCAAAHYPDYFESDDKKKSK